MSQNGESSGAPPTHRPLDGRGVPEPGKPFLFTPGESLGAEDSISAVFRLPTGFIGPEDNVAILPVLPSDPDPVLEGRVGPTRTLEKRPYGRVIAPRKRSNLATIELQANGKAPEPILDLLHQDGIRTPPRWRARRRRLASPRRVTWLTLPLDTPPGVVLAFICDALAALTPDAARDRFLLVRSRFGGIGGVALGGRD